jgi:hypothetical protein
MRSFVGSEDELPDGIDAVKVDWDWQIPLCTMMNSLGWTIAVAWESKGKREVSLLQS